MTMFVQYMLAVTILVQQPFSTCQAHGCPAAAHQFPKRWVFAAPRLVCIAHPYMMLHLAAFPRTICSSLDRQLPQVSMQLVLHMCVMLIQCALV